MHHRAQELNGKPKIKRHKSSVIKYSTPLKTKIQKSKNQSIRPEIKIVPFETGVTKKLLYGFLNRIGEHQQKPAVFEIVTD